MSVEGGSGCGAKVKPRRQRRRAGGCWVLGIWCLLVGGGWCQAAVVGGVGRGLGLVESGI